MNGVSACGRCQAKRALRETYTYIPASARNSTPQLPTSAVPAQIYSEQPNAVDIPGAHDPDDEGGFASEVKAAVDARLGLPSSKKRCPIPLTDAPLFGSFSLPDAVNGGGVNPAENVLPSRKHANELASLYWRCLEPLEPLFDRTSFCAAYQALFGHRDGVR
ncbi:hypothetical protein MAP00_004821 [Monascus purpureus]|nr:hypothetical protein MAP00_004821 [Monascus purpureus]